MDVVAEHPLVLNFGHPLNQLCQQQLDRELPGWMSWRLDRSYRVGDTARAEVEIRGWLAELERDLPGWSRSPRLYYLAHSFSPVNTVLLDILDRDHGVKPVEIRRDRAPKSPVEIFIVHRIGDHVVDACLKGLRPVPGFLVNLGGQPLTEEHIEQVRMLHPPWLDLKPIHAPVPEASVELEAKQIDALIDRIAHEHHILPEEHPCILAWFHHGGHPNDVIRFIARFHGVTGYFPSMVKFRLKPEHLGAVNSMVLNNLANWEVVEVESYGEIRATGSLSRGPKAKDGGGRVIRGASPSADATPGSGTDEALPAAVALVAFQWPRWARNHTLEERSWPSLLTRLDGILQPGGRAAKSAGIAPDILRALSAFKLAASWVPRTSDASALHAAVRVYLEKIGSRYGDRVTDLEGVRGRLEGRLVQWTREAHHPLSLEVRGDDPASRRVAVSFEALVERGLVPLLQNAVDAGARSVRFSSRLDGRGNDEVWLLELWNDGVAPCDLDALDEPGRVHGGMGSILALAEEHLATLRVKALCPERGWRAREWHAGSWLWNETRNGLVPISGAPLGWGDVDRLPRSSHLPEPWTVGWELAFPLAVLGE